MSIQCPKSYELLHFRWQKEKCRFVYSDILLVPALLVATARPLLNVITAFLRFLTMYPRRDRAQNHIIHRIVSLTCAFRPIYDIFKASFRQVHKYSSSCSLMACLYHLNRKKKILFVLSFSILEIRVTLFGLIVASAGVLRGRKFLNIILGHKERRYNFRLYRLLSTIQILHWLHAKTFIAFDIFATFNLIYPTDFLLFNPAIQLTHLFSRKVVVFFSFVFDRWGIIMIGTILFYFIF